MLLLLFLPLVFAKVDFCEDNQLPNSIISTNLQFTKELGAREYAVDSKFKSLHCCAKGYLSIEWFKDGRAYPWPGDLSSFIIYPESENQTVYTKMLRASDAGNYTCRLHNDTADIRHNTELKVFDSSGYMENPLATYKPDPETLATIGQQVRLFCEAFVGDIDLPDATNEVSWAKLGNSTLDSPDISVQRVQREKGQVVGAYLIINNLAMTDLGTYVCTISNTGDQKIIMETTLKAITETMEPIALQCQMAFLFLSVSLLVVTILFIYMCKVLKKNDKSVLTVWQKVLEIKPFPVKQFPVTAVKGASKKTPTYLVYCEENEDFAEDTFSPVLKNHPSLIKFAHKIMTGDNISEEIRKIGKKSRRVIVLLSSHMCKWSRDGINDLLESIVTKDTSYYFILLQSLPDPLDEPTTYFRKLENTFTLLPWEEDLTCYDHPFWIKISAKPTKIEEPQKRFLISNFIKREKSPEENV